MSHPNRRPFRAAASLFGAIALVAGLAACTNGKFRGGPAIDVGLELVGLGKEEAPEAEPITTTIGPPLFVGYQAIRVAIPSTGTRGQSRYFVAPDGVEIAMNNGFVTRVIGLGIDLEGMFLPVESPYLGNFVQAAREGAVTERVADYYVKGRILHDSFRCGLTYIPREGEKGVISEQCRRIFGGPGFQNTYWTEGDRVVCSLQWFHPDADSLQFFETPDQAQSLDLSKQGC